MLHQPPGDLSWVRLDSDVRGIEAKLALLKPNDCITLLGNTGELCTIKMSKGFEADQLCYEVRPVGCTKEQIEETTQIYAMRPNEVANHIISLAGVGGYLIPGNSITINEITLHLPEFENKNVKELPEAEVVIEVPKLDDTAVFPAQSKNGFNAVIIAGNETKPTFKHAYDNGELAGCVVSGSRPKNQDVIAFVAKENMLITIINLDGHYKGGNIAAGLIAQLISEEVQNGHTSGEILKTAPYELTRKVIKSYPNNYPNLNMGTCVAATDIQDNQSTTAHMGDCKVVHLRLNSQGLYKKLTETKDHTEAQELLDTGKFSFEDVKPFRHRITKNIEYPIKTVDAPEVSAPLQLMENDLILSFSDGAQHFLIEDLIRICNEEKVPEKILATIRQEHQEYINLRDLMGKGYDDFSFSVFCYHKTP